MNCNRFFISSVTSIALGILIYLLFRTSSLKVFSWLEFIGVNKFITKFRNWIDIFSYKLPEWFLFSFPDSLWVFSYVCVMLGIWKGIVSPSNLFWVSIVPFIAVCSELGQLTGFTKGTFDFLDIIFYIIGSLLPLLLFKQSITYHLKFLQHENKH